MSLMSLADTTARDVVPQAIAVLQARGYRLVTVAECLGMSPYQNVTRPQNVRGASQRLCHSYLKVILAF